MKYAEEHPDEVLEVIEDKTEAMIRDLEARQREAKRAARRATRRPTPQHAAIALADVPF